MWPPNGDDSCNYSFVEHADLHPHDHYHHHHHFPHSSAHHTECFQTLSCPSDLPVESSYYHHQVPPTYQDLGHIDLSPQFWCAEVDCAHERCLTKEIPHEQTKIFEEISKECEHFLNESDCEKCKITHEDGREEAIPISDLVDIVLQVKEKTDTTHVETKLLSRKREQNKVAAARYRDKQKAKWQDLLTMKTAEEKRNARLKKQASELEKQVEEIKALFLAKVSKK